MSRMYERYAREQLATGTITLNHGLEFVEVLGYSGLDFICIDLMVTSLDWSEVAQMVLAAKRYQVTPWVRLSTYPWGEQGEMDPGLPAQVSRAFALGAECVLASVNSAAQVKRISSLSRIPPALSISVRAGREEPSSSAVWTKPSLS